MMIIQYDNLFYRYKLYQFIYTLQINRQMFFCKDIKVYNYEYHCQCSRRNNARPRLTSKKKNLSQILALTTNQNMPTLQSKHDQNLETSTLLQKIKRRTNILSSTHETSSHKKQKKVRETAYQQPMPSLQQISNMNLTLSKASNNMHEKNGLSISYSLPKQTLISHTYNEQLEQTDNLVQQQSELVNPQISDRFTRIQNLLHCAEYEQYLAFDNRANFIVSIKEITGQNSEQLVYKYLNIYNKIGSHKNILQLYQICFHQKTPLLIMQPYLKYDIGHKDKDSIADGVKQVLLYLQKLGIYAKKLNLQDIRRCFDVWKITNLFLLCQNSSISIQDNIDQLLSQIQ